MVKIAEYLEKHKTNEVDWEAFLKDQGVPAVGSKELTESEALDSRLSKIEYFPATIERLRNIGVLNVYYPLFPGDVNLDEIGSFKLTRLGIRVMCSLKKGVE